MKKNIKFSEPNFEAEWVQAEKVPEFRDLGKKNWASFAATGYKTTLAEIKDKIKNIECCDDNPLKKQRVCNQIAEGKVETPIVIKLDDDSYEIVAGKTRIRELDKLGINDLPVWIVDTSSLMFLIQ